MTDTESECVLCGLPTNRATSVTTQSGTFCCRGCSEVHDVLDETSGDEGISSAGKRSSVGNETAGDREQTVGETAYFRVEGMHCSSCETFLERIATDEPDISAAEASYVTETVRVDYDPAGIDTDDISERLSRVGYRAYRRDDEIARRSAENWHFGRLAAGVLFGMMVMLQYVVIIYPTYFGGLFYDERTTEFLTGALATGPGRYFFVMVWLLTTVVLFFTGRPILRGAYVSLRTRTPNMDLLVTLAAMSAYVYSILAVLVGRTDIYFDVTVAIIVIVTVGSHYETTMKRSATEMLENLTRAKVDEARRIMPGGEEQLVSVDDLQPGERILVKPGDRIPVDGRILDGPVAVDESIVTGESLPTTRSIGEEVIGGGIVVDGSAIIEVGEHVTNSVDRIAATVWDLQSSNRGIQRLADKLATIFVPVVAVLGVVVFGIYLLMGAPVAAAMLVGLTVLIVSCPCALGLATPLAVASSVKAALERGIVIFDDTVFERIRDVDAVIFDKTGTLTTGTMVVTRWHGPDDLLEAAALVEQRSSHPVASAIVEMFGSGGTGDSVRMDGGTMIDRDAREDGPASVSDFTGYTRGVGATVDGEAILVGHPALFGDHEWSIPPEIDGEISEIRAAGNVPVVVGREGRAAGVIGVGDEPRRNWEEVLGKLADRGTEVYVLTGDDRRSTAPFADHEAVERIFAGVPPEAKAETVRRLGADGRTVMVGEGTNDAPALAAADLGIALGGGTAMAADAADVAILADELESIETVFDLADAAGSRVKQNIGWAFCYNAIAIPIAVAGLLNPLFAAVAMALSSSLVVTNSSRQLLGEPDEQATET